MPSTPLSHPRPGHPDAAANPPRAAQVPVVTTHHGDTRTDPYGWLADAEDPAVLAHLEAENAWTAARTDHLGALRETLVEEVRLRTQEDDLTVPAREGGWWYYRRTVAGAQHPLVCRAPAGPDSWEPPVSHDGEPLSGEQVLLDGSAEAAGHDFFALGAVVVSPDGALMAWAADTTGDERYLLRVRDLVGGADLPDEVSGTAGSAAWADPRTLLTVRVDDAWRPHEVVRHRVGEPAALDEVVLAEPDERYWLHVGRSRSGAYLVASAGSKTTAETWVMPTDDPHARFALLLPRREGVDHAVEHAVVGGRSRFLVLHDDGAEDFRLDATPDDAVPAAAPERWTSVLPPARGTRYEQVEAFAGFLAVGYRRDSLPRVGTVALHAAPDDGLDAASSSAGGSFGELVEVGFAEPLSGAHLIGGRTFDQPAVRLVQGSFLTPAGVHDLHVASGRLHLRRRTPVLGGYDAAGYEERREWAVAPDDSRVPVSVVALAGAPRDGSAPCLLTGYGSYELSSDPAFSPAWLSLLDRGVVVAVAHVRGGGEMGRHWYEQGKLGAKPTSFTDFLAVAEHLVETGAADGGRLVASGGSAGGLLVGAAVSLAPSRFAGVLAQVPFVDPLTTMLDESLPLTVVEQEEWGDPIRDAAAYASIKAYSPYENVVGTHPPMLVTTSLHDTRVRFTEPAKWVARIRERDAAGLGAPRVLLRTELAGGHGGASGRYEQWREAAFEDAWVLDVLGRG